MFTRKNSSKQAFLVLLAAGALTLSACGGGDDEGARPSDEPGPSVSASPSPEANVKKPFDGKEPAEVQADALDAMAQLKSYRVKGKGESGETFTVTVHGPKSCLVKATAAKSGEFTLRLEGKDALLKGNEAFWRYNTNNDRARAAYVLAEVGNKWLSTPLKPWEEWLTYCDANVLFPTFAAPQGGEGSVGQTTTVGGVEVTELVDKLNNVTVGVEAEAPHRMVSYVSPKLTLSFSHYDALDPLKPLAKGAIYRKALLGSGK